MNIPYKPYHERSPDLQYRNLLKRIIHEGVVIMPQQDEAACMVLGHQMRFSFSNGFPLLTERDLATPLSAKANSIFHQALGELFCFLSGGTTLEDLERFGCTWWSRWATEEKCRKRGLKTGDLGPGSYGGAWASFPTSEGKPFDQIAHLIKQIKELPHLRTHFLSPWIPQYIYRGEGMTQKVVVVPCHGWAHVLVYPETRELSLHHFQRSGDVPVGVAGNLMQYAALTLMIAQVTGYRPKELVYTISDAHIYEKQISKVDIMLSRIPRAFPTVTLDPGVRDIREFRQHQFHLWDYHPHEGVYIWTPV